MLFLFATFCVCILPYIGVIFDCVCDVYVVPVVVGSIRATAWLFDISLRGLHTHVLLDVVICVMARNVSVRYVTRLYTSRFSVAVMIKYICISMCEVMWLFKLCVLCCVLRVWLVWCSCMLQLYRLHQFVACTQGVGYANVISSMYHVMSACMLLVLVLHLRW